MPRTCAIEKCKQKSRSVCSCCSRKLCQDHLKEHDNVNNPQLNPLINEFNTLNEQLKSANIDKLIGNCCQKLLEWRDNSCKLINQLYEQKIQELNQRCLQKLEEQRIQLAQVQTKMAEIIHQQEIKQEPMDSRKLAIRQIQEELKNIENAQFQLVVRSLEVDDGHILIEESEHSKKIDLSNLTTTCRTIDCTGEWGPALVSNHRYLLIDRHPNLCLINHQLQIEKQTPWKFDFVRDMCWSSTLNCFIVTTRNREVFLVNERTLAIEPVTTIEEQDWLSCTCSETSFYLTTRREGTNIFEFSLLSPSFELTKRWKPPHSCKHYEIILNLSYKNKILALVISHSLSSVVHLEVRSSTTFDRLWSVSLNVTHTLGQPIIRCSALNCDEWLVIDNNTSQLFHIRKDGIIKAITSYNPSPWNAITFTTNILAIRTKNSVQFYKV